VASAASTKESNDDPIRVAEAPAAQDIEGERKTVTTLFADIKGSMDLEEGIDPEDARAIVDPVLKLMIDAVHHYDGYVAQSTGDGIFALFGAPVAHEDDPQRALHAALRMQEDLHRFAAKQRGSGQTAIEARIGIHTGEVVLRSIQTAEGRDEYVPVGHSIGLASRMQALAPPGSIVVTESTRKLCEGYFNYRSLGPTNVKGVSETVEIYEVTGLGPLRTRLQRSAARGLTRFIGREDEMRTLWNRWEVAREGEGQMVLIVGEAGIGKSRVMHQFHERLAGSVVRWLEGAAEPYYQNTPFHAVVAMVNQAFGVKADQTPEERLDQLQRALKQNGINASEEVALLAQLLNLPLGERYSESKLPPEQARKRLLATLVKTLFALAASQPMVLALEDLHWADASTLEFLGLLVEQAATSPVMVLVTARPEFDAPWPSRGHHAQITLRRLRDREVREMVASVAAKTALTNQAIEAVTSRASGVPLFVEELTRAVLERDRSDASSDIPETLQNSLIARLDRLGSAKEAAQVASVIGREFS
jgi:class 3 adenylate cyclase